ncbi:MAG: type II toxin-antitoxin system VapC family toxin [Planctomycetia bacterium]|nr:type II toxin-antitoxin system VapC family toxin [Planctomycetia bacterium]
MFVDALYWVAIVRPRDQWKGPSRRARAALGNMRLVTTDEVLTEFLAALSRGGPLLRRKAVATVRKILTSPNITVVPQSRESFIKALARYAAREDKGYSVTDCSSMDAMDSLGVHDALTADVHFTQEGYNALITS